MRALIVLTLLFAGCGPLPSHSVIGPCFRMPASELYQRTGANYLVHSVEVCPVERNP